MTGSASSQKHAGALPSRLPRVLFATTVAMTIAYVGSILFVERPESGYSTFWDGWFFTIVSTLPAVLAALRGSDRRAGFAWWLIAAGLTLNSVGNITFTFHDQNLDPFPYPAWSDAGYIGSYVAYAIALLLLTQRRSADVSKAVRLDGLMIGLSVGSIAVAWWFDGILAQSGSTAAVLVGMAYPLIDVVLIVILFAGLAPWGFRPDLPATLFMFGIVASTLGDVVFLRQQAAGTYVPNTWLELTWLIAGLLFCLAPWAPAGVATVLTTLGYDH